MIISTRIVLTLLLLLGLGACGVDGNDSDGELARGDVVSLALVDRGDGPPDLQVLEPADGAVVTSPFTIRVRAINFALAPAGRTLDGEGHWHVLLDQGCLAAGTVIPNDDVSLHVGSGASEAEFDLKPGRYDLCVQAGDGFHVAVNVSHSLSLTVVGR
jgi:hypothetical protein